MPRAQTDAALENRSLRERAHVRPLRPFSRFIHKASHRAQSRPPLFPCHVAILPSAVASGLGARMASRALNLQDGAPLLPELHPDNRSSWAVGGQNAASRWLSVQLLCAPVRSVRSCLRPPVPSRPRSMHPCVEALLSCSTSIPASTLSSPSTEHNSLPFSTGPTALACHGPWPMATLPICPSAHLLADATSALQSLPLTTCCATLPAADSNSYQSILYIRSWSCLPSTLFLFLPKLPGHWNPYPPFFQYSHEPCPSLHLANPADNPPSLYVHHIA